MLGRVILLRNLFALLFFFIFTAQAGITLNATRVIYQEGKKEVTLGIKNDSSAPRLIQAWMDAGEGSEATSPFIIVPPIFRVDPGKGQSLRIRFTGGTVPRDRESVFWINVLEISPTPPGKKAGTQNVIQFPVRSRLKLFYRPKDLPGSPQQAVSTLQWRRLPGKEGVMLECTNPSAFNISFHDIRLTPPSGEDRIKQSGMCPARGKVIFSLQKERDRTDSKVFFSTIDDYGSFHLNETRYRD